MTTTTTTKAALKDLYRTVASLHKSVPVTERRERLRNAVTTNTTGLDHDELVELVYGLTALLERPSHSGCCA